MPEHPPQNSPKDSPLNSPIQWPNQWPDKNPNTCSNTCPDTYKDTYKDTCPDVYPDSYKEAIDSLRQLQIEFGAQISAPHAQLSKHSAGGTPSTKRSPLKWIAPQPPLNQKQRLEIYQNGWWLRLSRSLIEDFPILVRCLGKVNFRKLTRHYLQAYPPHSFTLVHLGNHLPEYLSELQDRKEIQPWMVDLARFERADYQAYHAADPIQWNPETLAQLGDQADQIVLRTQPSVTLIESQWQITQLLKRGKIPAAQRTYIVVYREGFRSTHLELSPEQYSFLQISQKGATLNEWIQLAGDSVEWVGWLGDWAKRGILYPAITQQINSK